MDVKFVVKEIDYVQTAGGRCFDESNVIFEQEMTQTTAKDFMDKVFSQFSYDTVRYEQVDDFSFIVEFLKDDGVTDVRLEVSQINNKRLIETDIVPKGKYFINYH